MSRIDAESAAFQKLMKLMADAQECRRLFAVAGIAIPEPLARFLGEEPARRPLASGPPPLPGPEFSPRPAGAQPDWISVSIADLTPTGLVVALLAAARGSMKLRDLLRDMRAYRVEFNEGSVANIGTRLAEAGMILRSDDGWSLRNGTGAPVLSGDRAWGSPEVFGRQELAAHRRDCVVHLLRLNASGLQVMQIVDLLTHQPWIHAPLTKDLIKVDIEELAKRNVVKRVGGARKWILSS